MDCPVFYRPNRKSSQTHCELSRHCYLGFFAVVGISFYVGALGPYDLNPKISFGYSYVLAWFAACLNAVAGVYFAVISRYFPRPQKLSVQA